MDVDDFFNEIKYIISHVLCFLTRLNSPNETKKIKTNRLLTRVIIIFWTEQYKGVYSFRM